MLQWAGELEHTSRNVWQAVSDFWGSDQMEPKFLKILSGTGTNANKLVHKYHAN